MSLVDEKVTVRRANAVLTINREDVDRYIKKGYDVLNSKGEVIEAAVPNDVNTLQKAYNEHLAKIKELEKEIDSLKEEMIELKAAKSKAVVKEVEPEEVKPKKTTSRKKKTDD